MKKRVIYSLIFVLVLVVLPASFSLHASGGEKKIQIEFYGGFALLDLADLNSWPEYQANYDRFLTEDGYNYYSNLAGDLFTYTGQLEGEYKTIKNALPMGVRVKYRIARFWWLSLGFNYLTKSAQSDVTGQYEIRSLDPDGFLFYDEFSVTRQNSPYSISVKGYAPLLGIHYKKSTDRPVNWEAFLAAGPMFFSCDYSRHYFFRESDTYGYWYRQESIDNVSGKGTGLAIDAGLRLNIRLLKQVDLFIEGGFAYQRAGRISGPGDSVVVFDDANADGYTLTSQWEGTWVMIDYTLSRVWGEQPVRYPWNSPGSAVDLPDFKLDLSGFRLKAGIAFRL